jgi:hypothetical protein
MKIAHARLIRIASITTVVTCVAFGVAYLRIERPRPVTQFEATMASMPLGISPEEADAIMGSAPDTVTEEDGILATPVMMYAASNEKGAPYGEPRTYTMRMWERAGVKAVVAVDHNGKVAGRWAWRQR